MLVSVCSVGKPTDAATMYLSFVPDQQSAEWVIENVMGTPTKINKVDFTKCYWSTATGVLKNINDDASIELRRHQLKTWCYPSLLGNDGRSFSISYN